MRRPLIALAFLLTACDHPPAPPKVDGAERTPNPVFETQIQAVQKARAVEGQLQDAADAQARQIEKAEGQ